MHVLWQVRGVDARQWPRPLVPDTTEKMLDDVRVVARTAPHERLVRDWALVLMAVGIECAVERHGDGWDLVVDPLDAERAAKRSRRTKPRPRFERLRPCRARTTAGHGPAS